MHFEIKFWDEILIYLQIEVIVGQIRSIVLKRSQLVWKIFHKNFENWKNFQTNHLQSENSSSLTYPRFLRRKRIPVDVIGAADFE